LLSVASVVAHVASHLMYVIAPARRSALMLLMVLGMSGPMVLPLALRLMLLAVLPPVCLPMFICVNSNVGTCGQHQVSHCVALVVNT
jgi:hypothetical protein